MLHGPEIPYFREVVVFLIAAVLVVPLFQRLKVSPVLGYLAIGVVVGPFSLGIIDDVEGVRVLATLGIVFLMFSIGLELSLERLWAMRRYVFQLGSLQVVVTGAVIFAVAWAWGNSLEASIILGACLALSSTAVVIQLLVERGEVVARIGRVVLPVLLLQDLAVVPILLLVNALGPGPDGSTLSTLGPALILAAAVVALVLFLGRLLLRPLFRMVASTRSPELFMAMTLLAILGTAAVTNASGLSMALGAFLAGLVLAETEFRHQVEADIQPFKGLLLGLFFISVGMGVDVAAVANRAPWIGASVIGLIAIKSTIAAGLCLGFGVSRDIAVRAGLLLGQAGEFAFVVVGAAMTLGLMPRPVGQFMLIVAALSMMVTPLLDLIGRHLAALLLRRGAARGLAPAAEEIADLADHVVIAGYGRVGQTVAALLEAQMLPYVALDMDAGRIAEWRRRGLPVYYGDARRRDVLEKLNVARAAVAVITIDEPAAAARTLENIRRSRPDLPVYMRARDVPDSEKLAALGASHIVPETVESSLQLAGQVLHGMGTPIDTVNQLIEQVRERDYAALYRFT